MKKFFALFLLAPFYLQAQIPCKGGEANGFGCSGIDLMARVDVLTLGAEEHGGVWVNDLWGWTDPMTGKEYALVGMTNGTSFVDISDPVNPVVLGVLREHNWNIRKQWREENQNILFHDGAKSVWRDIKTYQNYAYIVSEDPNHGIQVFDLTELRNGVVAGGFFEESGHYNGIGKAHNVVINEETGFLYAVGFNQFDRTCAAGGLHIVDLADPLNPVYAGCYDNDGYTHDSQCVVYHGPDSQYFGKEVCFSSNENTVTITDVENKGAPSLISRTSYSGVQYTHQGWLTEDHKYFISNDELDEWNGVVSKTTTFIWDMEDLDNPQMIGTFQNETASIDHNLYVKDDWIYQSNYSSGLRILNMDSIQDGILKEDLYFDTYKSNDALNWSGSWSNYPYFESGLVIVSDQNNGLFIVDPTDYILRSEPEDVFACAGQHLNFPVNAVGDGLTFQWQIDEGSGFENITDFERYHSTTSKNLHAHAVALGQNGNKYRCMMTDRAGGMHMTRELTLTIVDTAHVDISFDQGLEYEVSFTNETLNGTEYTWNFGDGSEESNEENPVHRFPGFGSYQVTLSTSDQCDERSKTFVVELNECTPVSSGFSTTRNDRTISFQNNSLSATDYIWDFGDNSSMSSEESPNHEYADYGEYEAKLIAHDGCDADTLTQLVDVNRILDVRSTDQEILYPNPSSGVLRSKFSENIRIEITSLDGKIVHSSSLSGAGSLDLRHLQAGLYLVRIKGSNSTWIEKLILTN